ncbi:DUF2087 domain-containing protein [Allonocardiopsis opalescens]|uniref:DUF2087 domain-containing protein n=1 Tax=Allonocardiopsis opalescens TaxID=1144618 RepID=A0A2T0QBZ3_9ACTN|nr:DUF2087 domain-containing protein [Allonocardiopsis opalescens]PRY01425.1 hypothetical protein CLV72_1017 [Allonocardiopsis opalescens]
MATESATVPQTRSPSGGALAGLLAEPDRRAAFAALVLGATTASEVAERAGLRPAAAAAALHRLVSGGLAARDERTGGHTVRAESFREAARAEALRTGQRGGSGGHVHEGRLRSVPRDPAVRARVLAVVAESFPPGESYTEPQVNEVCRRWFDDVPRLRRALVDEGLLVRDRAGTAYRRA